MVVGENIIDDIVPADVSHESEPSNDPETLLILESIVQRLKPRDAHHVRDMIQQRGWISGALFMSGALFWWIAINQGSKRMEDDQIPNSLLGSFDFSTLSLIVVALVLVATLVMVIGREKGNAGLSLAGGLLAVLAIFYIVEPVILQMGDLEPDIAMFASGRMLMLAIMVSFASRFMFDAMLLQWVRASMLNMEVDVFHVEEDSFLEGHADESPPLA